MRTSHGGRASKGKRELLGTRAPTKLADAARDRADALGQTMNDYLVMLIVQDLDLPQFAPSPLNATRLELPISDVA